MMQLVWVHRSSAVAATAASDSPLRPGSRWGWLRTALAAACALPFLTSPGAHAAAPQERSWCGAGGVLESVVEASRSEFFARRRAFLEASSSPRVSRDGDIAVIEDDGSILTGNRFDLTRTSLRFTPKGRGYRVQRVRAEAIGTPQGRRLELDDDDSAFVELPGFRFPFYGRAYDGVWVNSDGNLTFGRSGAGLAERSLVELIAGPPRVAGLFSDLDPGRATGAAGVWVESRAGASLRVVWHQVPLRQTSGTATLEVVLDRSGRIDLALGEVERAKGVVGVSPGRTRKLKLADLSRKRASSAGGGTALAEEFTGLVVDIGAIARAFHSRFATTYMTLATWFDFPIDFAFLASHRLLGNQIRGIGIAPTGSGGAFGSPNLQSFVTMGSIDTYPEDPDETFSRSFSTLDVLGHEVGHRWLAFVRFADGSRAGSRRLLGRQLGHWSFFFDSDASLMEGNDILDLGGGKFRTVDASVGFSRLDLYLMGMLPPEEVPPLFWVEGDQGSAGPGPSAPPAVGVDFTGVRHDLVLDDIIAQEGERSPSSQSAPRSFGTAFVIVTAKGQPVRDRSIAKLDRLRTRWEGFFSEATGGRGAVTSQLNEGATEP